ncbi:MAG: TnpV protein [Ruminococcus sp.]|nr:TnpV protein [Ruminococcus sp.]
MTAITYTRQGDYDLPDLTLPDQPQVRLGVYAQMRRRYLKEHHKILYYNLLTTAKLIPHLADIEQTAMQMEENLLRRMAKKEGVTEKLKAQNPLEWIRLMNNLRHSAQETVKAELIYTI